MENQTSQDSDAQDAEQASTESWQEVGRQFQALGVSLAATMRAAWQNEENRQRLQEMQNGVEEMASQVNQAIRDTAAKPEAQQVKQEATKAAENVQVAVEQVAQEVRPHLLSALRQVNDELKKIVTKLEQPKP